MLILFPLLPPQSYCFHTHTDKKKILCFKDLGSGILFYQSPVYFGTRLQSYSSCSKENENQRNFISEFFMIISSVLVCQRTPQGTRLTVVCSPFVTRSVLLILSLSASLGVSDNLLRRKPLTCSELV